MKVSIVIPTLDPEVARVTGEEAVSTAGMDVDLIIVHDKERTGATKQLNIGFKQAFESGADYICYINDDSSRYQENWLIQLIEALEEDPLYMIVCPGGPCRSGVQRHCMPGMPKEIVVANRLAWFCVVIKRKLFEEIGFLDEQFSHYAQDGDFSFRAAQRGYKTICAKHVYVHHDVGKPVFPWWREDSQKLRAKWNMQKKRRRKK